MKCILNPCNDAVREATEPMSSRVGSGVLQPIRLRRTILTILLHTVLGLSIPNLLAAATHSAATCQLSDVSAKVNSAQRGDIVNVPAGTCTWSSTLTLTKGISLIGAGRSNTILTRGGTLIAVAPDPTAIANDETIRVTGFTFDGNNTALSFINVTGASENATKPYRNLAIGNNTFRNAGTPLSNSGAISTYGQVRGVIYGNIFDRVHVVLKALGNDQLIEWSGGKFPFAFGNSDNLFFEDNIIQYSSSFGGNTPGWIETGHSSRVAVRYNTWNFANVTDSETWDAHGFQYWPGGQVGTMIVEYYGNVISNAKGYRWINHRGSWGLYFNNMATGTGGMSIEANVYSCTSDVPGATGVYKVEVNNTYAFNNTRNGSPRNMDIGATGGGCGVNENDEFYNYDPTFNGTTGIGRGTSAPTGSCTVGTAYWVASTPTPTTNPSIIQNGTLYKCTSTNKWTAYYRPYTYPHPLATGTIVSAEPPVPPSNLSVALVE